MPGPLAEARLTSGAKARLEQGYGENVPARQIVATAAKSRH